MLRASLFVVALAALTSGCNLLVADRFAQGETRRCDGRADGDICDVEGVAVDFVCVADACVVSRCGDGVVDARTEACDDGNGVSGDGCEPLSCTPSCVEDAACDDGAFCTGVGRCVRGRCEPGAPPMDGALCGDADLVCRGGSCVSVLCGNAQLDGMEQCDDGNDVDGDGCDVDCTFSCESDAQCQQEDGDVCNGMETCDLETHRCEAGPPPSCDDADPCTEDACDSALGCVFDPSPFDRDGDGFFSTTCGGGDCDDNDSATYPGAPEICADGADNDCMGGDGTTPNVNYADCDGDGFAATGASTVESCGPPSAAPDECVSGSWTSIPPSNESTDCDDTLESVRPGADFMTTAIAGAPSGAAFDYDCDGVEEREYRLESDADDACSGSFGGCSGEVFWEGSPSCGATADLSYCAAQGLLGCGRRTTTAVVACR